MSLNEEKKEDIEVKADLVVSFKRRGMLNSGNAKRGLRTKNNSDEEEEDSIQRVDLKRPRDSQADSGTDYIVGGVTTAVYSSTKEAVSFKYGGDATHTSEIDTSIDRDARAVAERNAKLAAEGNDGLYKGMGAYKSFRSGDSLTTNASGTVAPQRAPSFLRSINRFDYQPAVCKDYKETGYCGFGDSCIYMHDRGDYKSGWQLEKEWEALQAKKKKRLEEAAARMESGNFTEVPEIADGDEDEIDYTVLEDTDLPFACYICREDFKNPVVTSCGHYFCQKCAITANKTDPKCKACGKPTFGVFNRAVKLEKKLALAKSQSEPTKINLTASQQGSWEEV